MTQPWSNQATSLVVIQGGAPGTGLFLYNGPPAAGNPPVLWAVAPGVTADPFGNPVAAVLGAGSSAGPNTQIDATGDITLTGVGGSLLQLFPAASLPFSLTTALTGIMEAVALFGSGDGNQTQAGVMSGIQLGTGAAAKMGTLITSPYGAAGSGMGLLLEATNDGNTDTPFGTFGTVTTQGGTLTFQPVLALLPYALLVYGGTGALTVVTQTSGSGTIPIPVGVTVAKAECWGPAGGGANSLGAGAGGGGEYAAEPALAVTGGGTVAYVIGAGGAGGAASGSTGHAGAPGSAATTLTGAAVTVTANPGQGGPIAVAGPRAAGGTGSTNTLHFNGGAGGLGNLADSAGAGGGSSAGTAAAGAQGKDPTNDQGAAGGMAPTGGGNGGKGGNGQPLTSQNGSPGVAPGGAGGGAGFSSTPRAGGAGANGQARLTYLTGAPPILASFASAAGTDQFGTAYSTGNVFAQPANPQVSGLAETWHTATGQNGWGTGLRYRLRIENEVSLSADLLTAGTATSGTVIANVPAGYRPAGERRVNYTTAGTTSINTISGLAIQPNGNVILAGALPTGTTSISVEARYPLD